MSEMIEVNIDSVRVSLMSPQRLVVLRQVDSERYLPIWVGPYEAEAITVALQEIEMARPLTHDLLKQIIVGLGGDLRRVVISSVKENTYFAELLIRRDDHVFQVDARPSDSIALALRLRAPIFTSDHLLDQFPELFRLDVDTGEEGEQPRVRLKDGVDEDEALKRVNSLPVEGGPIESLDDESIEEKLVPAARTQLATSRQQLLATMVLMGINRIGGSLGRSNACNLALKLWGDQKITDEVIKTCLHRLFARHLWLDIGRKRPIPHESWMQVAGYFYYYAMYYAALCIEALPPADRPLFQDHMARVLLDRQELDGSWFDYVLYDYHMQYGTAYAILALNRCKKQ